MEPKKVEPVRRIGLSGYGWTIQFPCHSCGEAVREDFAKEGNVKMWLAKGPRTLVCKICNTQHKAELDRGTVKITKL
jgi:hypothetical protein